MHPSFLHCIEKHFRSTCTSLNNDQNDRLRLLYLDKRHNRIGHLHLNMYRFDAELIESVLASMKRGKAAGLDELTVEHLTNSHPVWLLTLAELFNVITDHVCCSYSLWIQT